MAVINLDWSRFIIGNLNNRISYSERQVLKSAGDLWLLLKNLNCFACAVSIDQRTIYKSSIIGIFAAVGGKIILKLSCQDGLVIFLYYLYF